MKKYKVVEAQSIRDAEDIMNKMGRDDWRVVTTTTWNNFGDKIVITFEKDGFGF